MKTAWKELLYNKKRYLLIELIVILLLFMVLFLSGLVNGLGRAVSAGIDNLPADYFVLSENSEELVTVSKLTPENIKDLREKTSGETATLDIMRMYVTKKGEDEKLDIVYFGVQPDEFASPEVYDGQTLADSTIEHPIVLDDDFESEGIKIGDELNDSTTGTTLTVVGFTKDQMYGHVSVGFITHETYLEMRTAGNPTFQSITHALLIKGDDVGNLADDDVEVVDKKTVINAIPGYQAEQATISMVQWLLVAITAVVITIFYYVMTIQKERQFGVMKAIGISMGKITSIIFWQILSIAVIGALVADALVFAMSQVLPAKMPFYLKTESLLLITGVFVIVSIIGGLFSVLRVAKIDPVTVIGGEE